MQEFIIKPKNFNKWSQSAITKIQNTITSCETRAHLDVSKKMIDNFIIITAISVDDNLSEEVQDLSKSLWLSYKLKENQILSKYN